MKINNINAARSGFLHFLLASIFIAVFFCGCGKEPVKKKTPPKKRKIIKRPKKKEIIETEEGSFNQVKIKNWSNKDEAPKVEVDSSNVSIEDSNGISSGPMGAAKKMEMPPGSFAARIAQTSKILKWQPKWRYFGSGGPWLPAASLSPDSSALAIVETLGNDEGPYGSRLIFVETYNWNVVRIIELVDKKIEKICFIPGTTNLLCWASKQVDLKEPNTLFVINARNGRIISKTNKFHQPIACLAAARKGGKFFARDSASSKIFVFEDIRALDQFDSFDTGITAPNAPITVSPDSSLLAVLGDGKAEFYKTGNLKLAKSFETEGRYTPNLALFVGGNEYLATVKKDGDACFFRGDFKVELNDFAGNTAFAYKEGKGFLLAVEMRKKNKFIVYSSPEMKEASSFVPGKMRPRTKGETLAGGYLPHSRSIVLLDTNGNIISLYKPSKKWKKKVILSALK